MHTSNVYYPSQIDGNFYPVYHQLPDGSLVEVHFYNASGQLHLVYYQSVAPGYAPTPYYFDVTVVNGISNLIYFQPQSYGQNQMMYCTNDVMDRIVVLVNSEFNRFDPITVFNQKELVPVPPQNNVPELRLMSQAPNLMPVSTGVHLPLEVVQSLTAVQSGELRNVSVQSDQTGFHLTAEDNFGNRYVLEKRNAYGIAQNSATMVSAAESKTDRLMQVKYLREQGMTQMQISNHLGVSQKTVSNDIKELGIA